MRTAIILGVAAAASPSLALAHDSSGSSGSLISAGLLGAAAFGFFRVVRHAQAKRDRGVRTAAFVGGWLAAAAALIWPLDWLADRSFAAHMAQHMVLMTVAAPLLVLSQPLAPILTALPTSLRQKVATVAAALSPRRERRAPIVAATVLQATVIWGWHAPGVYLAAQGSELVHLLQHTTMMAAAIWFWWTLLRASQKQVAPGTAILCMLATLMHTGMLGGLLTFARRPLYVYDAALPSLAFWPIEDQQAAGLIMWVPGGLSYLAAGLMMAFRLLEAPAFGAKDVR